MAVPEAAMYKNDGTVLSENQVRFPRKVFHVEPEPKAGSVAESPDQNFRFCVCPANTGHIETSRGFVMNVHREFGTADGL